jgi:steroid 5-alpha reductase family enzyme
MTHAVLVRVAEAWALAAALQLALWLVQRRTRNAGIVDIGWAGSFALVVAVFAWRATAPASAWGPLAVIVAAWSVRLAGYLWSRDAARGAEEGRYADLRARWAASARWKFFVFFQAQAALTGVLSTAFVIPFLAAPRAGTLPLRLAGAAVSILGILGETVADAQLARWRRDPAHCGQACDIGLWSWSRHPNYFFEWCVWLGYALAGLAYPWPWCLLALLGQAIIVASIFGVTGIPPTEKQAIRSKGDAYREYQKRVSRFIPLPPKRARPAP